MMIKHERPPEMFRFLLPLCSIYFYKLEDVMGSSVGNRELTTSSDDDKTINKEA